MDRILGTFKAHVKVSVCATTDDPFSTAVNRTVIPGSGVSTKLVGVTTRMVITPVCTIYGTIFLTSSETPSADISFFVGVSIRTAVVIYKTEFSTYNGAFIFCP